MHTSIKAGLLAATTALGLAVAVPANAQDIEGTGLNVSGNVALTTDYRFRGISFSDGDVAIQGGIDVGHESGFYVGTWGSSLTGGNALELDVYGGWSGEVASGVTFDIGMLYYMYPDAPPGVDIDYWEPYASLGFAAGPVDATVGVAYAWEQDALGNDDNLYLYLDLSAGIPDTPITINGHLGYTDGVYAPPALFTADDSGLDWGISADFAVTDNLTASVAYTGVERGGVSNAVCDDLCDDAIFFTLGYSM